MSIDTPLRSLSYYCDLSEIEIAIEIEEVWDLDLDGDFDFDKTICMRLTGSIPPEGMDSDDLPRIQV